MDSDVFHCGQQLKHQFGIHERSVSTPILCVNLKLCAQLIEIHGRISGLFAYLSDADHLFGYISESSEIKLISLYAPTRR